MGVKMRRVLMTGYGSVGVIKLLIVIGLWGFDAGIMLVKPVLSYVAKAVKE